MRTDVNLILMALNAHWAMVKGIFGTNENKGGQPGKRTPMTAAGWQAFSKQHNSRYHKRRRPGRATRAKGGASG